MIRHTSLLRILVLTAAAVALSTALLVAADLAQVKQLRDTGSCERCDLRDADLGGVNAELGDLRNADLRGAVMYKTILRQANLTGALLAFADLKGADMRGARGVNLDGATTDERTTCPNGAPGPCQ